MGKCKVCDVEATLKCSKCRNTWYCGKEHQKEDWKIHRDVCAGSKYYHNPAIKKHVDEHHGHSCCAGSMEYKPLVSQCSTHGTLTYHHDNISSSRGDSNDNADPSIPTQEDLIAALTARVQIKDEERPYVTPGRVKSFVDVRLVFTLVVETDPPPYNKIPNMMNLFCDPHAKLVKCRVEGISKYCRSPLTTSIDDLDQDDEELYALTKKEMKTCALREDRIRMKSGAEYKAPDGKSYFTLRDLVDVIEKDEAVLRQREENFWFNGIDVHNVVFEGFKCKNGVYFSLWGS